MRVISIFLFLFSLLLKSQAQPKLVVGIVVDQMRPDYIFRYWNKFGDKGFKRLYNEGFYCSNTRYNYAPTFTGPGHASIYTGTTPAVHGIIANNWYMPSESRYVYCTEDKSVSQLGGTPREGQMSPKLMLSTTIGDELRLFSNMRSKVVGVSIKDRGGILPAGHLANFALWFSNEGNWISSTFYRKSLPSWVDELNKRQLPAEFIKKPWVTVLPINEYVESTADDVPWEGKFFGEEKSVFPHDLSKAFEKDKYDVLRFTPYGNTLTKEAAIAALRGEQLGKDEFTDLLAVSFSSTDYVGHRYGVSAIETEDTYLRLDKDLAELIAVLEQEVGKGNFTLFLTADHAAPEAPVYLQSLRVPAGVTNRHLLREGLGGHLHRNYGDSLIKSIYNQQIFFDKDLISKKKLDLKEIKLKAKEYLQSAPSVSEVYTDEELKSGGFGLFGKSIAAGFCYQRSGDLIYNLNPLWMEIESPGTTHGSPYLYDSHVPLFFFGAGVKQGRSAEQVNITDIAPTISQLLNISYPSGCIGSPIKFVFK